MAIKPVPVDANGWKLLDRGSEQFDDRIALTTTPLTLKLGRDIKGLSIYVESGTVIKRGTSPISVAYLDAAAVVDAGDGEVTIAATGHGFTAADTVEIYGTTNYDTGTTDNEAAQTAVTLESVTTDTFNIAATYVEETISATAYAIGYRDSQHPAASSFDVPVSVPAMTPICILSASTTAVISITAWR